MNNDNRLSQLRIDKQSVIPIYRQIAGQVENLIKAGAWPIGAPLPSETALANLFQISVMTVRQAMTQLVNKGLIYRERGRGTFVAPQPLVHPLQRLESFTEDMRARGLTPSSKILAFETCAASDSIAEKLALESGAPVLHLRRLRLVDDRPVALHDAYLSRLDIDRSRLEAIGSLYYLLEEMGTHLTEAEEQLDAIVANAEQAALLKVLKGVPLLLVSRITYDQNKTPVELVVAVYRANFYRYTVRLYR